MKNEKEITRRIRETGYPRLKVIGSMNLGTRSEAARRALQHRERREELMYIRVKNLSIEAATEAVMDFGLLEEFQIKNNSVLDQTGREVYQIQPEDIAREVLEYFRNFDGFPAHSFDFEGVTYYFVKQ